MLKTTLRGLLSRAFLGSYYSAVVLVAAGAGARHILTGEEVLMDGRAVRALPRAEPPSWSRGASLSKVLIVLLVGAPVL